VTQDAPIGETIPSTDPVEAIDVVVAKIVKEKQSGSTSFDDMGGARIGTFNDGDEEERAEV
jgi:hypothetical protein